MMARNAKKVLRGKKLTVTTSGSSLVSKRMISKKKSTARKGVALKKRRIRVRDIRDAAKVRVIIKDNRTHTPSTVPVARREITPAILSPYRLPVPSDAFVAKIAASVGMLFVLFGSGLSILNLNLHSSSESNVAAITGMTGMEGDTYNELDQDPAPTINVDGGDILSGFVPVTITVPFATDIQMIFQSKSTSELFSLGSAYRVDDTTWKYDWLTQNIPNDEYVIKMLIRNLSGSYNYTDNDSYGVENVHDVIDNSELTPIIPDTSDTEVVADSDEIMHSDDVFISIPTREALEGTVTLTVQVWGASSVGVQAKNVKTGALYYVGHGVVKDEGVWRVVWNTTNVPDGTYEVYAKALVSNAQRESVYRTVVVDNIADDNATSTTTEDITEQMSEAILSMSDIDLSFPNGGELSEFATLRIVVPPVEWVEVYAQKLNSLTPFFLGLAKKNSDSTWTFVWQTTQSPNGDYNVYTRVKSAYGFTESKRIRAHITNQIISSFTSEQEDNISALQTVSDTLIHVVDEEEIDENQSYEKENLVYIQSTESFVESIDTEVDTRVAVLQILDEYRAELSVELDALARAQRAGDEVMVKEIERKIEELKNAITATLPERIEETEITEQVSTYILQITYEMKDLTLKNEEILKERIGDAIHVDSDRDNVTDYDEVNLYRTNPFTADTDGDGHNDGVEVAMGYNPHDDAREALIVYESPKELGIVREDILVIHSISTLTPDSPDDRPKALITGSGLPNSFVTLYVYSTPIIVTVKTSADGSWSYILDKELDDGEHEIYVGVTDNAGKIVAKSTPLPFVKTAEAFAGGSTERSLEKEIAQVEPSLYAQGPLLLVASVAVVALGLVLMLLGLHMRISAKHDEQLLPT